MKSKILLFIFSLFFVSLQSFGQSINKKTDFGLKTSVTVNKNLLLNENKKELDALYDYAKTGEINEMLKLRLFCDANSCSAETFVIFNNSNPNQGIEKLISMDSTAPELWSVKNGQDYWINFMGGLDTTRNVPITVKTGEAGNYTLSYTEIASFGANIEVRLEDRDTHTWVNLGMSPDYTFQVSEATTLADRFFIHFVDIPNDPSVTITSLSDNQTASPFKIYTSDGAITISSLQQQSGRIAVFDMSGRTVAKGRIEAGATSQIDLHNNKGVYIVSINTDKGISNTKVIVN